MHCDNNETNQIKKLKCFNIQTDCCELKKVNSAGLRAAADLVKDVNVPAAAAPTEACIYIHSSLCV